MLKFKKLVLTGLLVSAVAMLVPSCGSDDESVPPIQIRYTWQAAHQGKVEYVIAGKSMMDWWYSDIYNDAAAAADEDFSAMPYFGGNPYVTSSSDIYAKGGSTANKGKLFEIDEGVYTAVCSIYDQTYDVIWEVVANYGIVGDPSIDVIFELAFDVDGWLKDSPTPGFGDWEYEPGAPAGDGSGYFYWVYLNDDDDGPVMYKKSLKKTTVKNGVEFTVQYFAFARKRA
jgi:hypothetical protein